MSFKIKHVVIKGSNLYDLFIDRLTFVLGAFAFKGKLKNKGIFKRFLVGFNENRDVLVLSKMDICHKSSNKE